MIRGTKPQRSGNASAHESGLTFDRRTILGLLGVGVLAAAYGNGIDVWETDPEPGADLRHWNVTNGSNQLWRFQDPENG